MKLKVYNFKGKISFKYKWSHLFQKIFWVDWDIHEWIVLGDDLM